jgi:hypothetical protein
MDSQKGTAMKTKTKKILINKCYGGFGLSVAAIRKYAEIKGINLYVYVRERTNDGSLGDTYRLTTEPVVDDGLLFVHTSFDYLGETCDSDAINDATLLDEDTLRDDPAMVKAVEQLGAAANGQFAKIAVVKIPDGVDWEIEEYDGQEWVSEKHRTWG